MSLPSRSSLPDPNGRGSPESAEDDRHGAHLAEAAIGKADARGYQTSALLLERGVEVGEVQNFPWGAFVFLSDPDGNTWLVQQIPPRG